MVDSLSSQSSSPVLQRTLGDVGVLGSCRAILRHSTDRAQIPSATCSRLLATCRGFFEESVPWRQNIWSEDPLDVYTISSKNREQELTGGPDFYGI